jgi:hypothetical protein
MDVCGCFGSLTIKSACWKATMDQFDAFREPLKETVSYPAARTPLFGPGYYEQEKSRAYSKGMPVRSSASLGRPTVEPFRQQPPTTMYDCGTQT